jgi:hypothetical protein
VRIAGIDAPELGRDRRRPEYLADEARQSVEALIGGRMVTLVRDPSTDDRDAFGRLLRSIVLADGRLVAAELVRRGHAAVLTRYPFSRRAELVRLEQDARRLGLGLWAEQGLAELRWNHAHGDEPVTLYPMTNRSWAVQYGAWIKPHVRAERVSRELSDLRRAIHELEPGRLERTLRERGYVRREP